jgi:DNA polymerase-3 subunit delta
VFYIYHGENEFDRAAAVKDLRAAMGDPQFAELNTAVLDGKRVTFGELRHHTDAIPFLAEKRLVIVEGLLARLEARPRGTEEPSEGDDPAPDEPDSNAEYRAQLIDYLPALPDSTELVFVESKTIPRTNPVLKLAEKEKKKARVRLFGLPALADLPDWIAERVESRGGRIEFSAANDLAQSIGADLMTLDNEIEKLLLYRHGELIRREDTAVMSPYARQAVVFDLVDALGHRQAARALDLLHNQLAHNVNEFYLLTMIARQYRLLLQVRDLSDRRVPVNDIQKQLGLHPFAAKKIFDQSRAYTVPQLESVMHRLLEADLAVKTGRLQAPVALELLIVELSAAQNGE